MGDDGIYIERFMYDEIRVVRPSAMDLRHISRAWKSGDLSRYFITLRDLLLAGFCLLAMCSTVNGQEIFKATGRYAVAQIASKPVAPANQKYLVSEPWCRYCPAATVKFLAAGNPAENIITIAEAKSRFGINVSRIPYEFTTGAARPIQVVASPVRTGRLPMVQTQWGMIDLETYQKNCNCPMCSGIRALQQQYRQSLYSLPVESLPPPQEPTPNAVIDQMLPLLQLDASSILADFGCGDGRILIAAVERYGCNGIGIEIDPIMADKARRRVLDSGLSGKIRIITGDVLNYDPAADRVTHAVAYLYPDLLEKLATTLAAVRVVASPFHETPGIGQKRVGDVWISRK